MPDHYETAFVRKDGARVEIEVAVKQLHHDGRLQTVTLVRDITERTRAQAVLRHSEEQLAEAQAIAGLGSWTWEVDHRHS